MVTLNSLRISVTLMMLVVAFAQAGAAQAEP